MPTLSVIMGIYNEKRRDHVMLAIDSILNQSYSDFEFLICDDGSPVEFYCWLERYCKKDKRIRLLRKEKNEGLSAALNTCIKYVEGVYIARMDADDISEVTRLEKQIAFLEAHSEYALVGSDAALIDERGVWGVRRVAEVPSKQDFRRSSVFIHPTIVIRTEVLKALNGYSTAKYVTRTEDYELFMRLYAAGYCGYNLQENLLQYREDRASYKKRKYCYRINEAKVRYLGFQMLGIIKGNLRYVAKPLIVGLIPSCLMRMYRFRNSGECGK